MTSAAKVSVIIPVYNSEKYLKQCLDSVCAQSLTDIEIICIDDGSTDGSLAILNEFKREDKRIVVISLENNGAGAARNFGMSKANAKYISFLDADDFFSPNMLETAYNSCEVNDADIAIFQFNIYNNRSGRVSKSRDGINLRYVPNIHLISYHNCPEYILSVTDTVAWNKLFRTKFILDNNLNFMNMAWANDLYFTLSALISAQKIALIEDSLMYYRLETVANNQSKTSKSPLSEYFALLATKNKIIELGLWDELEISFINLSLEKCIQTLYRYKWGATTAYHVLHSTLYNEGFENLSISAHEIKDYRNKWTYRKYVNNLHIKEANTINTSLISKLDNIIYNIIQYYVNIFCIFHGNAKHFGILRSIRSVSYCLIDTIRNHVV